MLPKIREDEWLTALGDIEELSGDSNGLTATEIAEKIGRGAAWVRKRLKELEKQGRLLIGQKRITRWGGAPYTTRCFKIKEEQQ